MWFYGKLIHKNLSSESNNSGLFLKNFILPPFAYEKVENRKKIGTILMRDVLRTLILKKNFSQQLY